MLRALSAGNGKLLDPMNQSGTWSADNPAIGQRGYSVQSYCRCGRLSA